MTSTKLEADSLTTFRAEVAERFAAIDEMFCTKLGEDSLDDVVLNNDHFDKSVGSLKT